MHRRTVHRGIAALALVTALALVGARPAAAMELGFLDRLGSLWSAVTGGAREGLWEALTGWMGGDEKPASPGGAMKQGSGSDPNGLPVVTTTAQAAGDDSH
jgi:hypothetical protein